ncbi:MAG: hypothetical protein LUB59_00920 [Candidatus Gastranaerophilales bacterium]|nr:hypothetical protein [Candidatus Gastranaerophilales bacterium]
MALIKLLDCTLRDGGYINNWDFGGDLSKLIIHQLVSAEVDYVECGFLSEVDGGKDSTLFGNIERAAEYIPEFTNKVCTLMLNFGEISADKISINKGFNFTLRIAFKRHHLDYVSDFAKMLIDKGYNISLNPMHTSLYTKKELEKLLDICNSIRPACLCIVDTMGIMTEAESAELFGYLDKNLHEKTALGFHSHNNLGLSFTNTKQVINTIKNRELIIDSCLCGIGRGGGILQTELIAEFLNKTLKSGYNTDLIVEIAEKYIKPIKLKYDKGYDYIYFLSAKNRCHPNYAKYLADNTDCSFEQMENIFSKIPDDSKSNYREDIISRIISDNCRFS